MNTLSVLFWSLVWMFLIALPGSDSGITFSLNPEKLPTLGGCQRTTATYGPIRGEYCAQLTSNLRQSQLTLLLCTSMLSWLGGSGVVWMVPCQVSQLERELLE